MAGFDLEISKEEVDKLPEPARAQFLNYSYFDKGTNEYTLNPDDERFVNHSNKPNVGIEPSRDDELGEMYALKDIQSGEELTENYHEFDDDVDLKIRK